ncbi:thioredoxin family protein [Flavobacterium cauense R2A-7]|uniref:Thioredoxin-like protein n=1 Tax=Flavobacterium cauense R2A-7 TaxID=1341154 RepID=V6S4Q4_9FLAO|nr:thioredoxin family protein [Flavobacterium cauense]ESU21648.1 thioredoxin family protein [Flavobacterium cauense R2A-7]KGO80106.1 thioredoxin [Flavobacterium cauense R2A-7]TWI10414.1 thioredoxin-like protein [Flavobacterium cauense R2A-7]
MKKILIVLLLTFGSLAVSAQDSELTWHTNIDKAMAISNKEKKPLMLFFTGSDWCGWCIRLQKEVFFKKEFVKWAKDNVVLVELDFPRNKQLEPSLQQQNYSLQNAFRVQGYPTVWFVNSETKEGKTNFTQLGSTGYVAGGPEAWISGANQILANNKKG